MGENKGENGDGETSKFSSWDSISAGLSQKKYIINDKQVLLLKYWGGEARGKLGKGDLIQLYIKDDCT